MGCSVNVCVECDSGDLYSSIAELSLGKTNLLKYRNYAWIVYVIVPDFLYIFIS